MLIKIVQVHIQIRYALYLSRVNAEQWLNEHSVQSIGNSTGSKNKDIFLQQAKIDSTQFLSSENFTTFTNKTKSSETLRSLLMEVVSLKDYALTIYSCIIIITIILTLLMCLGFFKFCLRASTTLHNRMFNKIVYSPMQFFNENPSGRILNRFAKDIGNMDETLPSTIIDTIHVGFY